MNESANWTIAYRKPRANHFRRVTNWSGTWQQSQDLGRMFAILHPELQVWNTSTKAAEETSYVPVEDRGTIMVESGKRIAVRDTAELSDEDLAALQEMAFEEIGRAAARNDEPAAPSSNQKVRDALEGREVADPANVRILKAFRKGYDAERTAQADEAIHDMPVAEEKTANEYAAEAYQADQDGDMAAALWAVIQAWKVEPALAYRWRRLIRTYRGLPAVPTGTKLDDRGDVRPRYEAVKTGSVSYPAMVFDHRFEQAVPGSSVVKMEHAVNRAAAMNGLPKYFAGVERDTGLWCVQENRVGGPRCSPRYVGADAQQQAEAKAAELNADESVLLAAWKDTRRS